MIFRPSHNLDIRQRRPHVVFERWPSSDHAIFHLKRKPIPIRKIFTPVAPLLQASTSSRPCAGGTHGIRIKVPYDDLRRRAIHHCDSTLASRPHYPTHRRRIALEPTRRRGAPRFPGYLHGLRGELVGRAEGCTGAVHGGDVVEKRTAVHDECKWTCLDEVTESWENASESRELADWCAVLYWVSCKRDQSHSCRNDSCVFEYLQIIRWTGWWSPPLCRGMTGWMGQGWLGDLGRWGLVRRGNRDGRPRRVGLAEAGWARIEERGTEFRRSWSRSWLLLVCFWSCSRGWGCLAKENWNVRRRAPTRWTEAGHTRYNSISNETGMMWYHSHCAPRPFSSVPERTCSQVHSVPMGMWIRGRGSLQLSRSGLYSVQETGSS